MFHVFLKTSEFALNIALDVEAPVDLDKIDDALEFIKVFKATLLASKSLFAKHEPLHKTILHFLELLTKNLLLAKIGEPASPLKEEFALMHKLAEYASL